MFAGNVRRRVSPRATYSLAARDPGKCSEKMFGCLKMFEKCSKNVRKMFGPLKMFEKCSKHVRNHDRKMFEKCLKNVRGQTLAAENVRNGSARRDESSARRAAGRAARGRAAGGR
eukprot:276097-Pyramimonas_sp.AAC.1